MPRTADAKRPKPTPSRLQHVLDEESRRPLETIWLLVIAEALDTHPQRAQSEVIRYVQSRLARIIHDHTGALWHDYHRAIKHQDLGATIRAAERLDSIPRLPLNQTAVAEVNAWRRLDHLPELKEEDFPCDDRKLLAPPTHPLNHPAEATDPT